MCVYENVCAQICVDMCASTCDMRLCACSQCYYMLFMFHFGREALNQQSSRPHVAGSKPAKAGRCEEIGASIPNQANGQRFAHCLRWLPKPKQPGRLQHQGQPTSNTTWAKLLADWRLVTQPLAHASAYNDGRAARATTESSVHVWSMPTHTHCGPNIQPSKARAERPPAV